MTFDVRRGAVHALLGGNGCGKSTLIKILAGVYAADAGRVEVDGHGADASHTSPSWADSVGLRFVHQAVGTFPDLSVAENFALGSSYGSKSLAKINWRQLRGRVSEVLERFELDVEPSRMMGDLSPSTQTMIAVARTLANSAGDAGVLVLDEPTASLPSDEVAILLDAIRGWSKQGHTVLLVTHRLDEVVEVATDVTFLRDGRHLETGPLTDMDERAMVRRISGMEQVQRHHESYARATTQLSLSGLAAGPLQDVDLGVREGEIVGVSGLLGAGRSTLLRTIFGARRADAGTVRIAGEPVALRHPVHGMRARIAYVPEDRQADAAFLDLTIAENLMATAPQKHWNGFRVRRASEVDDARRAIKDYGIVASSELAPLSTLSGGNQQKVIIARWLAMRPKILLLDEPTQGVDVGARAAIHDLVRSAAKDGTSVLVVSSDAKELVELCDRVVGLTGGRIVGDLSGDDLTIDGCLDLAHGLAVHHPTILSEGTV